MRHQAAARDEDAARIGSLRDRLHKGISEVCGDGVTLNGSESSIVLRTVIICAGIKAATNQVIRLKTIKSEMVQKMSLMMRPIQPKKLDMGEDTKGGVTGPSNPCSLLPSHLLPGSKS